MTQVTLKTIEQNDNVGMFSICFDGNSESEFEKFLMEFKDNATYNKDFNAILLALSKIIDNGALESSDYNQWLDKDGFHRTTIRRGNLSSQNLVDFCDRARREFYLRPSYMFTQAKMALCNSRERYRVLRGFGTLVKHLFRKHGELKSHVRQAPTEKQ